MCLGVGRNLLWEDLQPNFLCDYFVSLICATYPSCKHSEITLHKSISFNIFLNLASNSASLAVNVTIQQKEEFSFNNSANGMGKTFHTW